MASSKRKDIPDPVTNRLFALSGNQCVAQGDYGVTMTLVRTLDVRALIVATFVRNIGLLLAAASAYVIVRVYAVRGTRFFRHRVASERSLRIRPVAVRSHSAC